MRLVDLTHSMKRQSAADDVIPVVVRSVDATHLIPLDGLVTLATIVDLTGRSDAGVITLSDMAHAGVADIGGCILRTDWCDRYLSGFREQPPQLSTEAAAYILEGGVRTIAADFPIGGTAADMLLHNNCVLIHCVSNLSSLSKGIVRLVALPLKYEDTYSADARVIAMEE